MNSEQKNYILSQLDKMSEELEAVEDGAKRAELRGKYIELFIDMCTVSNMDDVVHDDQEDPITEDTLEEPESVVAETESILEEDEEPANVINGTDIFEDAEEVRIVLNQDEEEVDITEIYNILRAAELDEETADSIGLFLIEQEAVECYNNKFNYMQHGLPRAYAAYLGTQLEEQQLIAYIVDFSGLPLASVEKSTDFITEENAEELFDFVCQ